MRFRSTPVPDVWLVDLEPRHDERGSFARAFCREELAQAGITFEVAQANVAWNRERGTVRGLHYQRPPHAEAKIIRCVRGAAFLALVDLRSGSPAFAHPWTVTLRAEESTELYIPEGVANGYQTLEDGTELYYLMSASYQPEAAAGIHYADERLAIRWPLRVTLVSERDSELPELDLASMAL